MTPTVIAAAVILCALLVISCALGRGSSVTIKREGHGVNVEQADPADQAASDAERPKGSRQ